MSTREIAFDASWKRALVVLVVWAAIYLPGLGTLEIKGEEGRRILPAVTMLQTGNYLVPQVGSDPYFTKPPLVNWLVAGSFKFFGVRNEWAARLPSALCVLLVGLAFVIAAGGALGANGSLAAALIWLTNIGIIEKGRLIEIEALYASLTGLAMICWLSWWQQRRSAWLTWTIPWLCLGLGMLAKGPLHLVFFYAVVVAVLFRNRELRRLFHPAHFVGIVVMFGLFAAWAIPCLQLIRESDVAHTWTRQFSGRLSGEDFRFGGWLMNIPRGLGYFLPWTFLLVLVRRARFADERTGRMFSGLMWGIAVSFVGVSLLPGALARYTMPLLAAAAWLVSMLLMAERFDLPKWLRLSWLERVPKTLRLPVVAAATGAITIALYAFAAMPHLKKREKVRTLAAQVNAAIPTNEPLYAVDPDYQPFLFYVRDPIVYVPRVADLPVNAHDVLVQARDESAALNSVQWQPMSLRPVLRLKDYRGKSVTLLRIDPGL